MKGMFNRKKPDPNIIRDLKQLVLKKFNLPESTILSIAELSCHEPGCPPSETVITAREADGRVTNWRIHKPINEVQKVDINNLKTLFFSKTNILFLRFFKIFILS